MKGPKLAFNHPSFSWSFDSHFLPFSFRVCSWFLFPKSLSVLLPSITSHLNNTNNSRVYLFALLIPTIALSSGDSLPSSGGFMQSIPPPPPPYLLLMLIAIRHNLSTFFEFISSTRSLLSNSFLLAASFRFWRNSMRRNFRFFSLL